MEKISVIVPVYNVEKYIENCITSLLAQTYDNFEVLIVDDGSPDKSIEIAKEMAENDSRFIFLTKKNGGLPSARNYGIAQASGQYISFLDSDDYISPLFLEKMYQNIRLNRADVCICNIRMVTTNGSTIREINNNLDEYYKKEDLFLCNDTLSAYAWDKLYKAELFETMRYDEKVKTYEDAHFTFRIIYGKKISHMNEALYNYVQRPEAITKSLPKDLLTDKSRIINEFKDFANEKKLDINPCYFSLCYLKTLVYGPTILMAKYSENYSSDVTSLLKIIDSNIFTFRKILSLKKYSKKMMLALMCFKLSPKLFKILILKKGEVI